MKTETEKELRELDAWIGINVFGKKAINRDGPKPKKGIEEDYFVIEYIHISSSLPHYTTNPADAMAVLEKCCAETMQEDCIYIGRTESEWIVGHTTRNFEEVADTLPMAICQFAKQLFSK